ncbi:hypothetical protein PSTT_03366 [Puccinia striiformis]|uniref:Uncharacterized protein n=1 Tax=Puccinia striiformis TaxID=27350 RepID=A0A2S4VWU5_9BASI|nr:hypothetical protein PSTT_03366 [Puccinia striiformis]
MAGSTRDDACKLYGMIEFHNRASETEPTKNFYAKKPRKTSSLTLRQDRCFARPVGVDLIHRLLLSTPGFGPCAQGDDFLQDLGTPSVTKTDAKVQLRPS